MFYSHLQVMIRINRLLILPSVADKKITVKSQIRSLIPAQIFYGDPMEDSVTLNYDN